MTAPFELPLIARNSGVGDRRGLVVAAAYSKLDNWGDARAERISRARYIARAVNLHERLVEALKRYADKHDGIRDPVYPEDDTRTFVAEVNALLREIHEQESGR
jgi:hypothetical protein